MKNEFPGNIEREEASPKDPPPLRVAAVQLNTQFDLAENRKQAEQLIREAAKTGATFISTPEYTNILCHDEKDALSLVQYDDGNNEDIHFYCNLAKELGVTLNIGSLLVKISPEKMANRSFMISEVGEIIERYDKIHMFDTNLADGNIFRESEHVQGGTEAVVAQTSHGRVGMAICYDVRFPDLFVRLAAQGVDIFTIPSAYSMASGRETWDIYLRSRASENGAFVIAAAQCGTYENGENTCWGKSMIVSPSGEVLAEASQDQPGFIVADIDLQEVKCALDRYPVHSQRRDQPFTVRGEAVAPQVLGINDNLAPDLNDLAIQMTYTN